MATFDVSELLAAADNLRTIADDTDGRLEEQFTAWVDDAYETMRQEVPVDEGDLRDSIEVRRDGLSAEIIPTERVQGAHGTHSLGFLIEHGVGNRPPNPFISRTAESARERASEFDISDLL